MEAEEDDASRTSVGSAVPEPEGSTAPSGARQELGTAGEQCETETAAQLEENELEESLSCVQERAGEDGGGSAGVGGQVIYEGSEEAACMDESTAAVERELVARPSVVGTGKEEDSAASGGDGGDDVVVEEIGSVLAVASSPQVQSPALVAETDVDHVIGGEESRTAADVTASESAGAGLEEMKSTSVAKTNKDVEETGITSTTDAVEDNQVVVEETGKETDDVADKGVEVDIGVDQMEEVENQSKGVVEETEPEEPQPFHVEAEAFKMEIAHGRADRDRTEVVEDVSLVEVDSGVVQIAEAEEAGGKMDVDEGGGLAVKEAAGAVNESSEAGAVEDSAATEVEEVEKEEAEDDLVAETEEAVHDSSNVDDDMVEVKVKKAEDNMVVGDDEAQEAAMDNKEVDEEVLEVAEAEAAKNMEALHEDTDAMEESDAMEKVEKAGEVSRSRAGRKRKRRKAPKAGTPRISSRKMEEDVCFICYDGGDLVLCDRRVCPKAYHPSCVNHDEAFFRTKGQWSCGWHFCSNCGQNSYYMCYTCTYSLCKTCIGDGSISIIRKCRGFCRTCMMTIMMIEDDLKGDDSMEMDQVDFDDKSSWEYLFKDYYVDLKASLSLTLQQLTRARNLWKGSDGLIGKEGSLQAGDDSKNSGGDTGITVPKRKQSKRRAKSYTRGRASLASSDRVGSGKASVDDNSEWASKELVEFVMHMRNGDRSILSQYDVQALLLDYIKRNKLHDPNCKSQIICDQRLQNLFGKPHVWHFEMLKLLESHYSIKEDADDHQGTVVDTDANESEVDGNFGMSPKAGKDKRLRTHKRGDQRGLISNLDDYAAIDTHNINLMYLRLNLLEDLIEDAETFHDKVVGSFVRIRISCSNQKQGLYRIVPIVGTSKAAEKYKVGKRMTDFLLEVLNLNKTEVISIDTLSNQEFIEDECKHLRKSIKCGLINRLTVGNVQEKAMALRTVRVKDWLETETVRLSHLCGQASDMGRGKEVRECVEKLQVLKTLEERQRRLEEIPEIHVDPKMDPSYVSEEDEAETDDKQQESYIGGSRVNPSFRGGEPISPPKDRPASYDSGSGGRTAPLTSSQELSRNLSSKALVSTRDDYGAETMKGSSFGSRVKEQGSPYQLSGRDNMNMHTTSSASEVGASRIINSAAIPENKSVGAPQSAPKVNESEKMWHYQDPAGKIQGPFSMVQLRKWNNKGYFPVDLRIWRATGGQVDSILLTDALNGKFQRDPSSWSTLEQNQGTLVSKAALSLVELLKYSGSEWGSSASGTNLPFPTPGQIRTAQMNSMSILSAGNGVVQAPASASNASHSISQGAQKPEMGMLLDTSTGASQLHSQAMLPRDSYSNQAGSLSNLVQAVARNQNQSGPVRAETVAPSSAYQSEPVNMPSQPPVQGTRVTSGGAVPSIPSFASYVSSGSSNPWQVLGATNQSSIQSLALPNRKWPFGNNSNNAGSNYSAPMQSTCWTQKQGTVGWTASAPIPGNASMNWTIPTGNSNTGSIAMGWLTPAGSNPSTWASLGNQNGDGSQRNRPWNRQSSFGSGGGGGSGGEPSSMSGWCRFFLETGHCRKGASCNCRHT